MRDGRKWLVILLVLCLTLVGCASMQSVEAAEKPYKVYVQGTCDYDFANETLKRLNQLRRKQGVAELEMDAELLRTAMQRAAEIAVSFSHYRPDGDICFSASPLMYGENIAVGQTSPKLVMDSWAASQGHYENMISDSYESVGIGVFCANGVYYWVQCFGVDAATPVDKHGVSKKTYGVSVKGKLDYRVKYSQKTMKKGQTAKPSITITNKEQSWFSVKIQPKSLRYASSNKKVATVSAKGVVTAKKKGTAKITCRLGTKKKTITIRVK